LKEIQQTTKYLNSLALFQESGFLPFLQKFDGFHMGVELEITKKLKEVESGLDH